MSDIKVDLFMDNFDILWAGRVYTEVDRPSTADYIKVNGRYYIPLEKADVLEVYQGNSDVLAYVDEWLNEE